MSTFGRACALAAIILCALAGCGTYVPDMDLFNNDSDPPPNLPSERGKYENRLVAHVRCEIRNGVWKALTLGPNVQWFRNWGATVTLKMTVEEQSALNPSASIPKALPNATAPFRSGVITVPQSIAYGFGASGSTNTTRLEVITFTYSNKELLDEAAKDLKLGPLTCEKLENGILVQGDLKIGQFLYNKLALAAIGEVSSQLPSVAPYTTLSDDITFVTALGVSASPSWKFATIQINPTGTLFTATRTHTNDVLVTFGPVATPSTKTSQAALSPQAQQVHFAAQIGGFSGAAAIAQTPAP